MVLNKYATMAKEGGGGVEWIERLLETSVMLDSTDICISFANIHIG